MIKLKTLLICALFGISSTLYAQERTAPVNKTKTNHFERGSEIAISYGFCTLEEVSFGMNYGFFKMMESINKFVELIDPNGDTVKYSTPGYPEFYGSVNLTYSYRLEKWFEISGTFNYSLIEIKYYKNEDDSFLYRDLNNIINIIPEARFTWFRNRNVTLYSSVGLGVGVWFHSETSQTEFAFAGKIIPIGIKAGGKHFYGFAEFGLGSTGAITMGVGYKF